MFRKVSKKRLSQKQISSEYVKRQQIKSETCLPLRLRRSTQKLCNICNVSAEYYDEVICTNCGKIY